MDWLKKNWLHVFQVIALLIVIGLGVHLYNKVPDYAGKVVVATPAPEVAKVPKVDAAIKTGKVKVYAGGAKLKQKLTLPKPVVENDKEQIIASSKIAQSDNPHTVTTVINTDTGASETYVRTDPLPWFAFRSSGAIGVGVGFKRGEPATNIYIRQDIFQVKAAVLTGTLGADRVLSTGKTDATAMINVEYRW